jgi:SAM-dependent methyltransferase
MTHDTTSPTPPLDEIYTDAWRNRLHAYFHEGDQFAETARRYWAFRFDRLWRKHRTAVPRAVGLVRTIARWMPPKNSRVLVLGSFLGDEAIAYALEGARVAAVDLDGAALALSNELAARWAAAISTFRMDACRLAFASESFDLVSCSQVIEHVPPDRQTALLAEMWRVARPGGLLWIDTPNQHYYKDKHDTGLPFLHWLPRGVKTRLAARLRRDVPTREPAFGDQHVGLHHYLSHTGLMRTLRRFGPCEILSRYHGYADIEHYHQARQWEGRAAGRLFPMKLAALRLLFPLWDWNRFSPIRLVVRKIGSVAA